jgi:hypothetical protein
VDNSAAMRLVQGERDLCAVLQDLVKRERPFLQPFGKRFPFNALHNEVVDSVLIADIVQHANVRVIENGDGFGFSFKALLVNGITRKLSRKNLDRNGAIQPGIAGAVDLAHPASTEGGTDFIGSEECPRSEGHVGREYTALRARLYQCPPGA